MNRLAVDMLCFLLLLFKKGPWNAWFLEDEGRIISSKAREIILVYQYTKKTSFISGPVTQCAAASAKHKCSASC
jgi:hypothetical protein